MLESMERNALFVSSKVAKKKACGISTDIHERKMVTVIMIA